MITESPTQRKETFQLSKSKNRRELLHELPVTEKNLRLAGISTSVLLGGGKGPELILLHGPGESSLWWMRIIPYLVPDYRIIIPDLPGNGESKIIEGSINSEKVYQWISALIDQTCKQPPVLVGHVIGGAIAARFAATHEKELSKLVLVNTLGLDKFKPSLRFAFRLLRFMFQPNEKNYQRFLPHCMYDTEYLKKQMNNKWEQFIAYNVECANDPDHKSASRTMMKLLGIPPIPPGDLARIKVPIALIWGRHDRANKLQIAVEASKKYNWPLYIIEETRDDPKLERPEEFNDILRLILT